MEPARLAFIGGHLALVGPPVDATAQVSIAQIPVASRRSQPYEISIATADELRQSPKVFDESLLALSIDHDSIISLGVGRQDNVYFNVIIWKKGLEIRREMGLSFKQFHIALSEKDNNHSPDQDLRFTVDFKPEIICRDQVPYVVEYCKSLAQDFCLASSAAGSPRASEVVTILQHIISLSENRHAGLLDLSAVMLYKEKDMNGCLAVSKESMTSFPKDPRGYYRSAACYVREARSSREAPAYCWKLAMLLYAEAAKHALALQDLEDQPEFLFSHKLVEQACRAILQCAKFTEFGCVTTCAEAEVFPKEYLHLTLPWNPGVRKAVLQAYLERGEPDAVTQLLSLESRERLCVYDVELKTFVKLPRFFRWITPFRVAAMSTPKNAEDIRILAKLGIGTVVTLTKEEELNPTWFTASHPSTRNVFVPVTNYKAPTIAQIDYFFDIIHQSNEANSATLVHCGGGEGRAGTFIACYLARYGFTGVPDQQPKYTATEVTRTLRHMRPGSIETDEQEQFIAGFVKELWKRAQTGGKRLLISEPEPEDGGTDLHIEGRFNPKCKLILCCGIPGSGKSTVATSLAKAGWTVASQDETGSRRGCGAVVSAAMRQNKPVVVDRCNPTVVDRREWIDLAMASPNEVLCLFFDYDEALCLQRANLRLNHPTLVSASQCANAIQSMSKSLQRPSMAEGFGALVIIRNIAAANKFIGYYCRTADSDSTAPCSSSSPARNPEVLPTKFHKFPRTRHLFNFGAATRDDLIMTASEAASFFNSTGSGEVEKIVVTLEEKVDGANLGFSIDPETLQIRAQNRSHFVTSKSHPQFKKLDFWIDNHREDLLKLLCPAPNGRDGNSDLGPYILFGEWLQATHSIQYTRLSDYFLAFDLYDVTGQKFWSRERFRAAIRRTSISSVPEIPVPEGAVLEDVFKELMGRQSAFYDGSIEGVYVRRDRGPFLLDRGKVVRTGFISGNAHWSHKVVAENALKWS